MKSEDQADSHSCSETTKQSPLVLFFPTKANRRPVRHQRAKMPSGASRGQNISKIRQHFTQTNLTPPDCHSYRYPFCQSLIKKGRDDKEVIFAMEK